MTNLNTPAVAPELKVQEWLNTETPLSLAALRGKVVLIEAFQMLCPGCVSHSLPQAVKVSQIFNPEDVAVIGLHTVFEHHNAQGTKDALSAFLHEYQIHFPVAIDAPSDIGTATPQTMAKYQMRGTPSLIIIDREGRLRKHAFGRTDDMELGAELMAIVSEENIMMSDVSTEKPSKEGCDEIGCPTPSS